MRDTPSSEAQSICLQGITQMMQGRFDDALQFFDQAIEIDPSFAYAWSNRGYALYCDGRYAEAQESYDKAIELDPSPAEPWNGKGHVLNQAGKHAEALQAFEEGLKRQPDLTYAWNGKGNALACLGRNDEALSAYGQSCELDSGFAHPWLDMAILLKKQPELEPSAGHTAKACFCRAIHLSKTRPQTVPLPAEVILDLTDGFDLPVMACSLLLDRAFGARDYKGAAFVEAAMQKCEAMQDLLDRIGTDSDLSPLEKRLLCGMVLFHYGEPIRAFKEFDYVDSEDDSNLASQYYLVLSLMAYAEPSEEEIAFAMRQAEALLENLGPETATRQVYYAGQLFRLTGDDSSATICFAHNSGHFPSQCLLWHLSPDNQALGQQIRAGKTALPTDPPEPNTPEWSQRLQDYVQFLELEPVVRNLDATGSL